MVFDGPWKSRYGKELRSGDFRERVEVEPINNKAQSIKNDLGSKLADHLAHEYGKLTIPIGSHIAANSWFNAIALRETRKQQF